MPKQLISSMTGFGRGASSNDRYRVSIDLRAVNSRFLEVRPKIPRILGGLEAKFREVIGKTFRRGMIDISLNLQPVTVGADLNIDQKLAKSYAEEIQALSDKLNIPSGLTSLSLFKLPGVLLSEEAQDENIEKEVAKVAFDALDEAIDSLLAMRRSEGEKLGKVLRRELDSMQEHCEWIHKHRAELNEKYFSKLQGRVKEWATKSNTPLEDNRIYQEVAFYLDRSDITEELDRLNSHLKQCYDAIDSPDGKSVGKRLDFLAQELGREVNTIGSKSDQTNVLKHVVEMKLALERVREQVQNIE